MSQQKYRISGLLPAMAVLLLLAASSLAFAHVLRETALRQSVAVFGLLAEQEASVPAISRFLAEPASGTAYEAGLRVLQQAGYGETYGALLMQSLWLPTLAFSVAAAALILGVFLLCQMSAARQLREAEATADWLNSADRKEPVFRYLPAVLCTAMRELKRKLALQQELHEADSKKILQYMEDISHQLKTPLTVIRVACERTALRLPESEAAMETCRAQVDRMTDMIQKLLELGQLDCGQTVMRFASVSIAELIETVTNDLTPVAAVRDLSFEVEADGAETWLCDEFWMREALGNVLKNCIEHTENEIISIRCRSEDGNHQIVIRDHGDGFAAGCEARIFDRYFFGDRTSKESNGLGLSIAAQIMRLHFGTAQARNCEDGGAEFRFTFPQLDRNRIYERTAS